MARIACPKCNEPLDEVIRVIHGRCLFDEEADDYLTDKDDGFTDLCPQCKTELEKTYPVVSKDRIIRKAGFILKAGEGNFKIGMYRLSS